MAATTVQYSYEHECNVTMTRQEARAGRQLVLHDMIGGYDPTCPCCWLGFPHTEAAHEPRKPYSKPAVEEHEYEHIVTLECRTNPYM